MQFNISYIDLEEEHINGGAFYCRPSQCPITIEHHVHIHMQKDICYTKS